MGEGGGGGGVAATEALWRERSHRNTHHQPRLLFLPLKRDNFAFMAFNY